MRALIVLPFHVLLFGLSIVQSAPPNVQIDFFPDAKNANGASAILSCDNPQNASDVRWFQNNVPVQNASKTTGNKLFLANGENGSFTCQVKAGAASDWLSSSPIRITTTTGANQSACDPGNCFMDPCDFAICPNYPDAICQADYCGGCRYRFFKSDNQELLLAQCAVNLCDTIRCGTCGQCTITGGRPKCTRNPNCIQSACDGNMCKASEHCVPQPNCTGGVCKPYKCQDVSQCLPPKSGTCPALKSVVGPCTQSCKMDAECPGTQKCCKTLCGGQMCKDAAGVPTLPPALNNAFNALLGQGVQGGSANASVVVGPLQTDASAFFKSLFPNLG